MKLFNIFLVFCILFSTQVFNLDAQACPKDKKHKALKCLKFTAKTTYKIGKFALKPVKKAISIAVPFV